MAAKPAAAAAAAASTSDDSSSEDEAPPKKKPKAGGFVFVHQFLPVDSTRQDVCDDTERPWTIRTRLCSKHVKSVLW